MTERELPLNETSATGFHQLLATAQELEALIIESSKDKDPELMRSELHSCREAAKADRTLMKADLAKKQSAIEVENEEIVDVVKSMTDESAIDPSIADNAEAIHARGIVLSERWRAAIKRKTLLQVDIAALEQRMASCDRYLAENQADEAKLDDRPVAVNEAMGHLALALACVKRMPDFPAMPVPFGVDGASTQHVVNDDVAEVLKVGLAEEWRSTISIPVDLPKVEIAYDPPEESPPEKPRSPLPQIQLPSQAHRYITNVNGRKK